MTKLTSVVVSPALVQPTWHPGADQQQRLGARGRNRVRAAGRRRDRLHQHTSRRLDVRTTQISCSCHRHRCDDRVQPTQACHHSHAAARQLQPARGDWTLSACSLDGLIGHGLPLRLPCGTSDDPLTRCPRGSALPKTQDRAVLAEENRLLFCRSQHWPPAHAVLKAWATRKGRNSSLLRAGSSAQSTTRHGGNSDTTHFISTPLPRHCTAYQ